MAVLATDGCAELLLGTIVAILLLLLLIILLLLLVGSEMPGTVAESGTDTTRLSGCCCGSFARLLFTCKFCVITCCLLWPLLLPLLWTVVALLLLVATAVTVAVDWITFGLTFCVFGSAVVAGSDAVAVVVAIGAPLLLLVALVVLPTSVLA